MAIVFGKRKRKSTKILDLDLHISSITKHILDPFPKFNNPKVLSLISEIIEQKRKSKTLMAAATASPTKPGLDCQVPNPKEGILAPVFNSKKRISSAILSLQSKVKQLESNETLASVDPFFTSQFLLKRENYRESKNAIVDDRWIGDVKGTISPDECSTCLRCRRFSCLTKSLTLFFLENKKQKTKKLDHFGKQSGQQYDTCGCSSLVFE